jgi:cytochrome c oxidase cbb3-type subunit 3
VSEKPDELIDHEVDGIREFDNALPRWWLYGFYVTIVFAAAYLVNYHVLKPPFFGAATLTAEYDAEVEEARRASSGRPQPAGGAAVAVRTDAESLARGEAIFKGPTNGCFACHRADLGGLIGPNLTDDFWIHGCTPTTIMKNIATGFPLKGMQPYGTTTRLTDEQLVDVVSFVLSRQASNPPNPKAIEAERDVRCSPTPNGDGAGQR